MDYFYWDASALAKRYTTGVGIPIVKQFSLILILYTLLVIPMALAQDPTTATVRGMVFDASETQVPIQGVRVVIVDVNGLENETDTDSNGEYKIVDLAPGRYLLSIYKAGYGDRVGRPVTVVAGGEYYVPIKMTKRAGLLSLLERQFNSAVWPFLLCVGGAFVLGYFIGRAGRRTDH